MLILQRTLLANIGYEASLPAYPIQKRALALSKKPPLEFSSASMERKTQQKAEIHIFEDVCNQIRRKNFVRCHNGYLVNLRQVRIYMPDGFQNNLKVHKSGYLVHLEK